MPDPGVNPLQATYDQIERIIGALGAPVEECRMRDQNGNILPGQWDLRKGSASVYVDIYRTPDGAAYCCVASPVLQITTPKLKELYEKLLSLNHEIYAASFSINNGWVWLRILRECEGMDDKECRAMFERVGWYADQYDDMLKAEFGA